MFNKNGMTDEVAAILRLAEEEARGFQHEYIGTEHLVLGLVREETGIAATVLRSHGIDLGRTRERVEQLVQHGPTEVTQKELPLTPRARQALDFAEEDARTLGLSTCSGEHMLTGLLREPHGVAGVVLRKFGFELETLRQEVFKIRLLQMKIVERVVRPLKASKTRKRKMRDELLAHLSAIYDEELVRSQDPMIAVEYSAKRFGDATELTAELQATVPRLEQWEMRLDRTFGWRLPETVTRWMFRLSTQIALMMLATCLLAAACLLWEFGWSENVLLIVRPVAAMTIVLPLSFFVSGVSYYQMRNSLVGVPRNSKSTARALLWAALLAVVTTSVGIGFLVMAYGVLPSPTSDFWTLAVFGMTWAGFAFLYARANGPQEIRDTLWALLDLNDTPLAA